ncbi:MAG: hypothetical protein IJ747_09230 [Lachnospiraceae bacterium]|nr:hypothetical protein [Lachnospiraceae bacterium]
MFTRLPGGNCLIGMNVYTGLTVSGLALMAYWFSTRSLHMPAEIAFLGELVAISLCWCPTALLYNYLTYFLFTGCVILLYHGLTNENMWLLYAAGICLGMNVFVRFSNLPEAALILAVWAYAVWESKEMSKDAFWKRLVRYTGWCLGGYLSILAVCFLYIHVRYGMTNYVQGIRRLFDMTDAAPDYKSTSMVAKMVFEYVDNLYWIERIAVIALVGTVVFTVLRRWSQTSAVQGNISAVPALMLCKGAAVGWCLVAALMIGWLYRRGFSSLQFFTYGSIFRPGISFLTLALGMLCIQMLRPSLEAREKLLAALAVLMILLTSIGSNNGNMPSYNHLFLPAPYILWLLYRFVRYLPKLPFPGTYWKWVSLFPVKVIVVALVGLFIFQSLMFGGSFVFAEATGVQDARETIDHNDVLKGIRMNPERAVWMQEISDYAQAHNLTGQEVILFGYIPAMSYYLQMPSAFNPWSDLPSYSVQVMEQKLDETAGKAQKPVVLLERTYMLYMQGGVQALEDRGLGEKQIEKIQANDRKIALLQDYLSKSNYELTFQNDKFVLLESAR